jgi:hypothetical protein
MSTMLAARPMDRLLFGDNQFFGVNHMSEDKAMAQQMRFQKLDAILEVLDAAYDEGVRTFMCTTHERVAEICDVARREPDRYPEMVFYPCMPYAHKYANAVTDDGFLGAIRKFLPDEGYLDAAMRGTKSIASRDVEGLATLLVDAELKMFKGLATPVVWMQNVVVDLLLGLGFYDAFRMFSDHVRDRYGAEAGFITMNLPMLLRALDSVGVQDPLVCSNINKLGFRMSGGVDAYRDALEKAPFRAVAMSVFASGAIPARDAIEWVTSLPNVHSIVFGASSRTNIASTRRLVDEYWPSPADVDVAAI